jgi:taurine dioxygenase
VVTTTSLRVRRIAGALGAEIEGVDLRAPLNETLRGLIRQAFLDHQVIFFRDQDLSPQQFMDFAGAMGRPVEYPFVKGIDGHPCIIEVKKLEHERVNFGGIWHSDTTYLDTPPMGSMLLAREVPPYGGDTLFSSQYLAWDALSPTMQKMLDGLLAINSSAKADVSRTREDRIRSDGKQAQQEYRAEHPLVRTHPETGRKALYVNVAHTVGIKGLSDSEGQALLGFLHEHQNKVEFTCRFVWRAHSLAFWDNRCTQHNPINDYHGFRRVMHRITLAGDRPH